MKNLLIALLMFVVNCCNGQSVLSIDTNVVKFIKIGNRVRSVAEMFPKGRKYVSDRYFGDEYTSSVHRTTIIYIDTVNRHMSLTIERDTVGAPLEPDCYSTSNVYDKQYIKCDLDDWVTKYDTTVHKDNMRNPMYEVYYGAESGEVIFVKKFWIDGYKPFLKIHSKTYLFPNKK